MGEKERERLNGRSSSPATIPSSSSYDIIILVFSSSFKIPPPVVLYHASRIRNKKMAITYTRVELERMASKKIRTFMLVVVVGGGDVDVDVLFFIPYIYY